MPLTDDKLKAQMKAKAAAIEQLFAEKKRAHEITLSEIEQAVHASGEAIKADLATRLVEQVSEEDGAVPGPLCPQCGQEMHYKGHNAKQPVTETGEVTIKPSILLLRNLSKRFFPPWMSGGTYAAASIVIACQSRWCG